MATTCQRTAVVWQTDSYSEWEQKNMLLSKPFVQLLGREVQAVSKGWLCNGGIDYGLLIHLATFAVIRRQGII